MMKNISIVLAITACLINEFTKGLYSGFAYGASRICDFNYPTFKLGEIIYTMSHGDPYFYITQNQIYLTYALVIFLIGKTIEKHWSSQIVNFIPLFLCMYFLSLIESIKNIDINNQEKYIDLIRETANYSLTSFSIVAALIILQITAASTSLYQKYKSKQNREFLK